MRAVVVSHGQPGDPGPQQAAIEALAARVDALVPGAAVVGATLAAPGALAAALRPGCAVYPMFMAQGWFTTRELPRRIAATGVAARVMAPFGADAGLPGLCRAVLDDALAARGWGAGDTALLLAAHGSGRSPASAKATQALAALLAPGWRHVACGFVEQAPFLADAARGLGQAVCLPLFALRAEHVTDDLPAALAQAGFGGAVLGPVGQAPQVPAMIAASITDFLSKTDL